MVGGNKQRSLHLQERWFIDNNPAAENFHARTNEDFQELVEQIVFCENKERLGVGCLEWGVDNRRPEIGNELGNVKYCNLRGLLSVGWDIGLQKLISNRWLIIIA